MNKKLYIGGIPYESTEETLSAAFGEFGAVESVNIITDKMTGRSRGFGFVEMASEEEAAAAKDAMDGKDFEGRMLKVDFARPQENQ